VPDDELLRVVEFAFPLQLEDRVLAAAQRFDIARSRHRAVFGFHLAHAGAPQRCHLAIKPKPAVAHLHVVSRQANHALHVSLGRVAREAEHNDVPAFWQFAKQALRRGGSERNRQ
jgi:hypothetical protein